MAMMDDDNISAAITHGGGGGITLHSRWKSQFDDSEGCSDNETEMYVDWILFLLFYSIAVVISHSFF